MAGRPPTGDPVLRARRRGRGGRPRRRGRRAGRRGLRAHAVRPGRRGGRLHCGAGRAAGGEAAVAQPRRKRREPPAPAEGLFDPVGRAVGERVLSPGAAGAGGGLAVQLARARDAYVVGTAAAAELGLVRELAAQEAVDAATGFEDAVAPVDLVFDTVGGERLRRSGAVLRPGGRLVSVAEEPPDGGEYFTVEPNRDQLWSIARLADAGELRRPSVEIFPLASARKAFARSLEPGRRGKVVLAVT